MQPIKGMNTDINIIFQFSVLSKDIAIVVYYALVSVGYNPVVDVSFIANLDIVVPLYVVDEIFADFLDVIFVPDVV